MKILWIGNAIVDVICKVEDKYLSDNELIKSTMKLVDEIEFKKLLSTLRIEMGHVAGSELDGRTIPYDNSLEGMLSKKKDFIGKRSLNREAFTADDRQKVVGVVPLDKKTSIPEGSHLVKDAKAQLPNPKLGYISA